MERVRHTPVEAAETIFPSVDARAVMFQPDRVAAPHISYHPGEQNRDYDESGWTPMSVNGSGSHLQVHAPTEDSGATFAAYGTREIMFQPERVAVPHIEYYDDQQDRDYYEGRGMPIILGGSEYYPHILAAETPYQCLKCYEEFRSESELKSHLISHVDGRPSVGEEYGATFSERDPCHLTQHRRTHRDERPNPHAEGFQSSRQASNLRSTLQSHTGQRPSVCDLRPASFSRESYTANYMPTRLVENLFPCDVCGVNFSTLQTLMSHRKIHADKMAMRRYKCDVCPAAFTRSSNLVNHIRTHTGEQPYICETCDRAFKRKDHLKKHKITHAREKPFSCEKCSSKFSRKAYLEKHTRAHIGETPFECYLCGGKFNTQGGLGRHRFNAHSRSRERE